MGSPDGQLDYNILTSISKTTVRNKKQCVVVVTATFHKDLCKIIFCYWINTETMGPIPCQQIYTNIFSTNKISA